MDDRNEIVFAISKVGASHLPKGVPCQDYSLIVNEEDTQMIVVCDGHGSKTYVRSDVGSRLAAEITKIVLSDFVKDTSSDLFLGKKGAVTARPELDDTMWGATPNKLIESMTEAERMNYEQNQLFFNQVKDIREQDNVFKLLFEKIYGKWIEAIKKDSEEHPFTEEEKTALGNHRIEKAYGSTLMAFVKTPCYWFALHIGDGRLITVDRHLDMAQPVPWDCNCFQNFTTSLCNTNPVRLFRYAFDGTGNFPAAVFCCSDGIEDSYGDYELKPDNLHRFYQGLLDQFVKVGVDTTLRNIEDFLPVLSEKGSKDDMSLAAIINTKAIIDGLAEKIKDEIHIQESELQNLQEQKSAIECQIKNTEKKLKDLKEDSIFTTVESNNDKYESDNDKPIPDNVVMGSYNEKSQKSFFENLWEKWKR